MSIRDEIKHLAARFANELKARIDERVQEMEEDDTSHYFRLGHMSGKGILW